MNDKGSEASTEILIDEDSRLIASFLIDPKNDGSPLHFISEQLLRNVRAFSIESRRNAHYLIGLCDHIDAVLKKQPEEMP
jgi:hypothetical protein